MQKAHFHEVNVFSRRFLQILLVVTPGGSFKTNAFFIGYERPELIICCTFAAANSSLLNETMIVIHCMCIVCYIVRMCL